MLAQSLIFTSAAIIFLLGMVHLIYTFFSNKFSPRDPQLAAQLKTAFPVITRQTTLWKAFIGFNASHSLGALFFGAVYGYLALQQPTLLMHSCFLGLLGLSMLLTYVVLAKLYWFSVPLRGISLATACYIAGFASRFIIGA